LILRASCILIHIGRVNEPVEYLEHINDDDTVVEPSVKLAVLCLLSTACDKSKDHVWLIESITANIIELYTADFQQNHDASAIDYNSILWEVSRILIDACDSLCCIILLRKVVLCRHYIACFISSQIVYSCTLMVGENRQ
jgi:hypothetical protein